MARATDKAIQNLEALTKLNVLCENLSNYNIGQDDNIKLYAFYKQAMFGDCNVAKTEFKDSADKTRYSAWKALKGKSKKAAMNDYTDLIRRIIISRATE